MPMEYQCQMTYVLFLIVHRDNLLQYQHGKTIPLFTQLEHWNTYFSFHTSCFQNDILTSQRNEERRTSTPLDLDQSQVNWTGDNVCPSATHWLTLFMCVIQMCQMAYIFTNGQCLCQYRRKDKGIVLVLQILSFFSKGNNLKNTIHCIMLLSTVKKKKRR